MRLLKLHLELFFCLGFVFAIFYTESFQVTWKPPLPKVPIPTQNHNLTQVPPIYTFWKKKWGGGKGVGANYPCVILILSLFLCFSTVVPESWKAAKGKQTLLWNVLIWYESSRLDLPGNFPVYLSLYLNCHKLSRANECSKLRINSVRESPWRDKKNSGDRKLLF